MNYKPIVETYELGNGLTAIATYEDIGPEAPPSRGKDWPKERDFPRVKVTLSLPKDPDEYSLHRDLFSEGSALGVALNDEWGLGSISGDRVGETGFFSQASVAEAFLKAQACVLKAIDVLRVNDQAREVRLAQAEDTCRKAREGSPFDLD